MKKTIIEIIPSKKKKIILINCDNCGDKIKDKFGYLSGHWSSGVDPDNKLLDYCSKTCMKKYERNH